MNTILLRGVIIAAAACLTAAHADYMSPWGAGWANMPNDIHNTRVDTRLEDDNDAFLEFIMFGEGADVTNQFLIEEEAASEEALAAGHQVVQLAARLVPEQDFRGGGWARYTLFDDETFVSRVLNINVRLRLIKKNGAVANEALGLTADSAENTSVNAYFRYWKDDAFVDYATCHLVFDDLIDTDADEVADYAAYYLSLKQDQTGLIEGDGGCAAVTDTLGEPMLPEVQSPDIVDITVEEVRPVLMGSF